MKKSLNYKKIFMIFGGLCVLTLFVVLGITKSEILAETGTKVEPNTELTYYLDVYYDGIDKYGKVSSDNDTADITSSTITINDTLPDGLSFLEFIGSDDDSIGAVKRSDGSVCAGYVVDGVAGITYDETTRNVSFKIKNMQAGCKITVGIKTMTPTLKPGETRKDFYNTAYGQEGSQSVKSNTVHVWMGQETAALYSVSYEYEGTVPSNAPKLPDVQAYSANSSVVVANDFNVEGYDFSGWKVKDSSVTIVDGQFTMPDRNITLVGSFTEKTKYIVTYKIDGDVPEGYDIPNPKEYYEGSTVNVDSLEIGTEFNGYRFLGWSTSDVTISKENDFVIENNVTITGSFEEIKYTVSYEFQGPVLPPNANNYLPQAKQYKPGDSVELEKVNYSGTDYDFVGWYKEDNFIMPSEDVVIVGEWVERAGVFEPQITIDAFANPGLTDKKEYYRDGDTVYYKIVVTNPHDFALTDVMIEELDNFSFIPNNNYEIKNELVFINNLSAHSSIELYAKYEVTEEDEGTIYNEVEIIGALAVGNYVLNEDGNYKANVSVDVSPMIKICKTVIGDSKTGDVFRFHIESERYDGWLKLSNGECKSVYLDEETYKVSEVVPQEYNLESVTLTENGSTSEVGNGVEITADLNGTKTLTFENKYKKKPYYHSSGTVENRVKGKEIEDKIPVTIKIVDFVKIYDGIKVPSLLLSYKVVDGEVDGDFKINLWVDDINVGNYSILYSLSEETKEKYDVKVVEGTLTINPAFLTITTPSASRVYNGLALVAEPATIEGLMNNETATVTAIGSQTEVGSSINNYKIAWGTAISTNYQIIEELGTLTVTTAPNVPTPTPNPDIPDTPL